MIHTFQNATRHRYNPAMFTLIGCHPEELTRHQLLQRLLNYVTARQLAKYDIVDSGKAWLDTTDIRFRAILGLHDSVNRYMLWDAGQRMSGWHEIVEQVHARWLQD